MVEQGHIHAHQERATLFTHDFDDLLELFITSFEICPVEIAGFDAGKSFGVFHGIAVVHFFAVGTDVPAVILHEHKQRELLQGSHVQGF